MPQRRGAPNREALRLAPQRSSSSSNASFQQRVIAVVVLARVVVYEPAFVWLFPTRANKMNNNSAPAHTPTGEAPMT